MPVTFKREERFMLELDIDGEMRVVAISREEALTLYQTLKKEFDPAPSPAGNAGQWKKFLETTHVPPPGLLPPEQPWRQVPKSTLFDQEHTYSAANDPGEI